MVSRSRRRPGRLASARGWSARPPGCWQKTARRFRSLQEAVRTGEVNIGAAHEVKDQPVEVQEQALDRFRSGQDCTFTDAVKAIVAKETESDSTPQPAGAYRTIVVDTVWPAGDLGREAPPNGQDPAHSAMTVEEIAADGTAPCRLGLRIPVDHSDPHGRRLQGPGAVGIGGQVHHGLAKGGRCPAYRLLSARRRIHRGGCAGNATIHERLVIQLRNHRALQ